MGVKNELAEKLTELLKGQNKTDLAAKFNVSRQTIYDWCKHGSISDDHLIKLCAMLKIDPLELKFNTAYKALSIDLVLLTKIITAVEKIKKADGVIFEPSDYAATCATLYDIYKSETDVTDKTIYLSLKAMLHKA